MELVFFGKEPKLGIGTLKNKLLNMYKFLKVVSFLNVFFFFESQEVG